MPQFIPADWDQFPSGTVFSAVTVHPHGTPYLVDSVLAPATKFGGFKLVVPSRYLTSPGHWALRTNSDGTLGWVNMDTLEPAPVEVLFFDEHGDGTPMKAEELRPGQILEVHYGQASNILEVWVELGPKLDDQGVPIDDDEDGEEDSAEGDSPPASQITEDDLSALTQEYRRAHGVNPRPLFSIDPTPSTPWAAAYLKARKEVLAFIRHWQDGDEDAPLDLFRLGFRMGNVQGLAESKTERERLREATRVLTEDDF